MDRSFPLAVYSSFSPFATANSMVSLAPRAVTGARVTTSATATRSPPSSACGLRCLGKARRLELRQTEDVDDSPRRVDDMRTTQSRPAQDVEHLANITTLVVRFPSIAKVPSPLGPLRLVRGGIRGGGFDSTMKAWQKWSAAKRAHPRTDANQQRVSS